VSNALIVIDSMSRFVGEGLACLLYLMSGAALGWWLRGRTIIREDGTRHELD
jgi:hypothetical protein